MATIERKGLPDKNTAGALGDIYTDLNSGKKYKCTGSYGVSTHAETKTEYEWRPIHEEKAAIKPEVRKPAKEVGVDLVNDKDVTVEKTPVGSTVKKPTRQNYGKHYQNNRNAK